MRCFVHSALRPVSVLLLAAALLGSGCSFREKIEKFSQLKERNGIGPIRALTVDSLLYTFNTFSINDSMLTGSGTVQHGDRTQLFDSSIAFTHIVFIEGKETNGLRTLAILPGVTFMAAGLAMMLTQPSEFTIFRPSGSSCPSVYAFNGKKFELDAEAFGTSVSKALEATTYSRLSSLVSVDGHLAVRISNERPETHLVNSVNLFAADANDAKDVVLDVNNVVWPLLNQCSPKSAHDQSGTNILQELTAKDDRYWMSNLANTKALSGFRDNLELQFDIPIGTSDATLAIDAVNTGLITEVYRSVGGLLGDASLFFYRALESDHELQDDIRGWIREANLRIEVNNGTGWAVAGMMPPEANAVPFSRAIRIGGLDRFHGRLQVRLSSLTDVWRIDRVSIDYSPVQPLTLHRLDMISMAASDKTTSMDAIRSADSSYALLFPGHRLDIKFNSAAINGMHQPVFVIAVQGYLYEWFPTGATAMSSFVTEKMSAGARLEMLKLLIKHKDIFLPPIYAGWRAAVGCATDSAAHRE
jgi:hypothetical protein